MKRLSASDRQRAAEIARRYEQDLDTVTREEYDFHTEVTGIDLYSGMTREELAALQAEVDAEWSQREQPKVDEARAAKYRAAITRLPRFWEVVRAYEQLKRAEGEERAQDLMSAYIFGSERDAELCSRIWSPHITAMQEAAITELVHEFQVFTPDNLSYLLECVWESTDV